MQKRNRINRITAQRGLSLIELMISLTIGLILVATISLLFTNNSRTRQEIEKFGQQIQNGLYATQLISDDLHLAGFYGELNPLNLASPAAKPDPCATSAANLQAALPVYIQGYDNGAVVPGCVSDQLTGSDILVIRRASACVAGVGACNAIDTAKYTYFQTGLCETQVGQYVIDTTLANFTLQQRDCATQAARRSYFTRIYFIANNNKSGDGIPTLKMAELGSGSFSIIPLVTDIQQLQFEYGIDTGGDGAPDVYTANPDTYGACAGPGCQANWRAVTTAKINILARNPQPSDGYKDTKTYVLGKLADGVTDNSFGPFNDGYKRHAYTSVVSLYNVAGRLE